jgi:5-methyltetrahydropteroyltriglutamate--homocysteine methyltransferase
MTIPTEPIGSIPRPLSLIDAVSAHGADDPALEPLYESAVRDTVERFEATGSPIISDGEPHKYHNFWTYCVHGLPNAAPDGFRIPFSAGHTRRMPRLTRGPFRYRRYADSYLDVALRYAHVPVKQAVISPSALSLMYPAEGVLGYSREQFIDDLLREHETEIRRCLAKGASTVQIDFTEGRLAMKIDPTGHMLNSFIDLNNLALSRFSESERMHIGVHTCPGADRDSTHSADVGYTALLPVVDGAPRTRTPVDLPAARTRRDAHRRTPPPRLCPVLRFPGAPRAHRRGGADVRRAADRGGLLPVPGFRGTVALVALTCSLPRPARSGAWGLRDTNETKQTRP